MHPVKPPALHSHNAMRVAGGVRRPVASSSPSAAAAPHSSLQKPVAPSATYSARHLMSLAATVNQRRATPAAPAAAAAMPNQGPVAPTEAVPPPAPTPTPTPSQQSIITDHPPPPRSPWQPKPSDQPQAPQPTQSLTTANPSPQAEPATLSTTANHSPHKGPATSSSTTANASPQAEPATAASTTAVPTTQAQPIQSSPTSGTSPAHQHDPPSAPYTPDAPGAEAPAPPAAAADLQPAASDSPATPAAAADFQSVLRELKKLGSDLKQQGDEARQQGPGRAGGQLTPDDAAQAARQPTPGRAGRERRQATPDPAAREEQLTTPATDHEPEAAIDYTFSVPRRTGPLTPIEIAAGALNLVALAKLQAKREAGRKLNPFEKNQKRVIKNQVACYAPPWALPGGDISEMMPEQMLAAYKEMVAAKAAGKAGASGALGPAWAVGPAGGQREGDRPPGPAWAVGPAATARGAGEDGRQAAGGTGDEGPEAAAGQEEEAPISNEVVSGAADTSAVPAKPAPPATHGKLAPPRDPPGQLASRATPDTAPNKSAMARWTAHLQELTNLRQTAASGVQLSRAQLKRKHKLKQLLAAKVPVVACQGQRSELRLAAFKLSQGLAHKVTAELAAEVAAVVAARGKEEAGGEVVKVDGPVGALTAAAGVAAASAGAAGTKGPPVPAGPAGPASAANAPWAADAVVEAGAGGTAGAPGAAESVAVAAAVAPAAGPSSVARAGVMASAAGAVAVAGPAKAVVTAGQEVAAVAAVVTAAGGPEGAGAATAGAGGLAGPAEHDAAAVHAPAVDALSSPGAPRAGGGDARDQQDPVWERWTTRLARWKSWHASGELLDPGNRQGRREVQRGLLRFLARPPHEQPATLRAEVEAFAAEVAGALEEQATEAAEENVPAAQGGAGSEAGTKAPTAAPAGKLEIKWAKRLAKFKAKVREGLLVHGSRNQQSRLTWFLRAAPRELPATLRAEIKAFAAEVEAGRQAAGDAAGDVSGEGDDDGVEEGGEEAEEAIDGLEGEAAKAKTAGGAGGVKKQGAAGGGKGGGGKGGGGGGGAGGSSKKKGGDGGKGGGQAGTSAASAGVATSGAVSMSHENQALVNDLLASLGPITPPPPPQTTQPTPQPQRQQAAARQAPTVDGRQSPWAGPDATMGPQAGGSGSRPATQGSDQQGRTPKNARGGGGKGASQQQQQEQQQPRGGYSDPWEGSGSVGGGDDRAFEAPPQQQAVAYTAPAPAPPSAADLEKLTRDVARAVEREVVKKGFTPNMAGDSIQAVLNEVDPSLKLNENVKRISPLAVQHILANNPPARLPAAYRNQAIKAAAKAAEAVEAAVQAGTPAGEAEAAAAAAAMAALSVSTNGAAAGAENGAAGRNGAVRAPAAAAAAAAAVAAAVQGNSQVKRPASATSPVQAQPQAPALQQQQKRGAAAPAAAAATQQAPQPKARPASASAPTAKQQPPPLTQQRPASAAVTPAAQQQQQQRPGFAADSQNGHHQQQQQQQQRGPRKRTQLTAAEEQAAKTKRQARLKEQWETEVRDHGARRSEEMKRALDDWRQSTSASAVNMRAQRERLPSWSLQERVVQVVNSAQVCVVSGETGCGKTTQVPQFLLDAAIDRGQGGITNIICTQPRRISATSVSQRVAAERGDALGRTVGYSIRLESLRSPNTRLLFCTTGVLLRRLIEDPTLIGTTHVIMDEVHERSLESDFLITLLKDMLPRRPDLRLILMSATVNEATFTNYFRGAPCITIPGFTHPVKEMYLEDALQATRYVMAAKSDYARKDGMPRTAEARDAQAAEQNAIQSLAARGYAPSVLTAMKVLDPEKVNYDLVIATLLWIINQEVKPPVPGAQGYSAGAGGGPSAVLVFMPGFMEIVKTHEALLAHPELRAATQGGAWAIAMHSALSTAEQQQAFDRPPPGVRKIVIATNIAETSITIDDVVWVLDTGRVKEERYNPDTHMAALVECWVSRASARQRRGRAGRVQPGTCVRLFSRHTHDRVMAEYQLPEMLRVPLEGLVLQVKLQGLVDAADAAGSFLAKSLDPPSAGALASATRALHAIGAMDESGRELTPLGRHLALLPVDVRVGKMLLYAAILGCLDPVATIAAAMTSRSPFVTPIDKRQQADAAKAAFAGASQSDHLAVLHAFNGWVASRQQGGRAAERKYVSDNFLSFRALEGMADLKTQFKRLLREAGFVTHTRDTGGSSYGGSRRGGSSSDLYGMGGGGGGGGGGLGAGQEGGSSTASCDSHSSNLALVTAVLVAGLFPNVVIMASKEPKGGKGAPPKPKAPKMSTQIMKQQTNGTFKPEMQGVQIHPCSVNWSCNGFASPYLVFAEMVETSAVYLRDCSVVTPYALLLFGGSLEVLPDHNHVSIDKWVHLDCPAKVAGMFKDLRYALDTLLAEKIENPDVDIWQNGGKTIATVIQLLSTEQLVQKNRA